MHSTLRLLCRPMPSFDILPSPFRAISSYQFDLSSISVFFGTLTVHLHASSTFQAASLLRLHFACRYSLTKPLFYSSKSPYISLVFTDEHLYKLPVFSVVFYMLSPLRS